jgi:diguanylate cyclase (GGDEF)-like protein
MKIEDSRKVGSVGPLSRARKTSQAPVALSFSEPRQIDDAVSILGIPSDEMTPRVQSAIMQLVDEVNRLREELAQTHRRIGELASLADEDSLVPAANRRAFVRELTRVISFSERYGAPCSLIYFDLNDLKQINDQYGHSAGDAALTYFAESLISNVRDSDIVGRIGGDEFAVILLNSDETAANAKARQFRDYLMHHPMPVGSDRLTLRAAYGVYSFRRGIDASTAMAEADRAMYAEKKRLKEEA